MMFSTKQDFTQEKIVCYIDYKAWRFSTSYAAVYLLLVSGLAYITNCIGNITYPNLLFSTVPFLFVGGILLGVVALIMYTLKNPYIWAGSHSLFGSSYSLGLCVQDLSIIALHSAMALSFYARCKVGSCENEGIPFCNPEEEIDAFPFGHAHFLMMLPLITHLLITAKSFGAAMACWALSAAAMVTAMLSFGLANGTHYYIGYSGVTFFAIYSIEGHIFERYELCERTGTDVKDEVDLDSIKPSASRESNHSGSGLGNIGNNNFGKLVRNGSSNSLLSGATPPSAVIAKPLLGVPYVFINDLLMPTRFLKESNKSLNQLVTVLQGINKKEEPSNKSSANRQAQMDAIMKKMDIVLKQASVCGSLLAMQMSLAADVIKRDSLDTIRPKAQSVNLPTILMECITLAKTMQKAVAVNVLSAPKSHLISNILGDSDWLAEALTCMICNAIRMSSNKGTVHISIDIVEIDDKNGNARKTSDLESGDAKPTKSLRLMVDTDGVQAVKSGMMHPAEIMGSWVDFMQRDASDNRPIYTSDGSRPPTSAKDLKNNPYANLGGKKCHNGAAGLCMRGVSYRSQALEGSYDIMLGRIPNAKSKKIPLDKSETDLRNTLSVNGGCYFMLTIPYKAGPPIAVGGSEKKTSAQSFPSQKQPAPQPKGRKIAVEQDEKSPGHRHRDDNDANQPVQRRESSQQRDTQPQRGTDNSPQRRRTQDVGIDVIRRGDGNDTNPKSDDYRYEQQQQQQQQYTGQRMQTQAQQRQKQFQYDESEEDEYGQRGRSNRGSHYGNEDTPSKFVVSPSRMVMQVARRFDRRGNYGISDSDSEGDLDVIKEPRVMRGEKTTRKSFKREHEDRDYGQRNGGRESRIKHLQGKLQQDPQQHPPHNHNDHRSSYRNVIQEINSALWRENHAGDSPGATSRYGRAPPDKVTHMSQSTSSLEQLNAVDEAIEMLTKAKMKLNSTSSAKHSPGERVGKEQSIASPFAIPYNNRSQSVLLIIPGNIADSQDAASAIIRGLKDAGKQVQMESNFVYALNMLLSGVQFDVIVMDISECNSFEATEFVRRLRAWEKSLGKQGNKEIHQFVAAITLDDVIISADNELHSGVDTLLAPPIKVTAILDILNIIKILSV